MGFLGKLLGFHDFYWEGTENFMFFPSCQVRLVRFYVRCAAPRTSSPRPSSSSPDLICQLLIAVGLAGSHLPALDSNGPRRTSSASSWLQWASPDLICQLLITVAFILSGILFSILYGFVCGRWGAVEVRRGPRRRRISPVECQKICQIECQIECQKICQIECQKICQVECQVECQKICQIECQKILRLECLIECQIGMPDRMSEDMPDRMSEYMADRMPEDMPDRMPADLPDRMPDRLSDRMSDGMNWMPWWDQSLEARQFF